jgi:ubiquinone biosynthesis protein
VPIVGGSRQTDAVGQLTGDKKWGAFSDTPPWQLEHPNTQWSVHAVALRRQSQQEVPSLIIPARIPPVGRMFSVVFTLAKALVPWFVKKKLKRFDSPESSREYLSLRLRRAVEQLGAAYIKLGQIISSGEGLFPKELVDEFKRCRDQVPAEPFEVVKLIVEQDLGARIEDVFSEFDTTHVSQPAKKLW